MTSPPRWRGAQVRRCGGAGLGPCLRRGDVVVDDRSLDAVPCLRRGDVVADDRSLDAALPAQGRRGGR